MPRVIGGRYGLSSKEFTPAMAKAASSTTSRRTQPTNHFTVGIVDDVSHTSLPSTRPSTPSTTTPSAPSSTASAPTARSSANKNSIKIIGERTDLHAQGYFVYDSKKAGAVTVSHLRFGPQPIPSTYLIQQADFVACHQFERLESTATCSRSLAPARRSC